MVPAIDNFQDVPPTVFPAYLKLYGSNPQKNVRVQCEFLHCMVLTFTVFDSGKFNPSRQPLSLKFSTTRQGSTDRFQHPHLMSYRGTIVPRVQENVSQENSDRYSLRASRSSLSFDKIH